MTQQVLVEQKFTQSVAEEAMERGHKCFKFRKWDEAVHEFRKAVEIDPCSAKARYWLAHAYSVSDPDFSIRRERSVDAAIDEYKNAIELDPSFGPPHARLANLYHAVQGKADEAVTFLKRSIESGENPQRIHRSNGWFDNIRHTKEFQSLIQSIEE